MNQSDWRMPVPDVGDAVLFSLDMSGFANPTLGWVTSVGDTTISILTFTPGGFVQRNSVHHKDDPANHGEHGWHDMGCWEFTKSAAAIRELTHPAEKSSVRTTGSK